MCDGALRALVAVALVGSSCSSAPAPPVASRKTTTPRRSPAEFMSGDECLFCHRDKVGVGWQENGHNLTLHEVGILAGEDNAPTGAEYALGARQAKRWLRSDGYGTLAMRTSGGWDEETFGTSCAGCHASGVDPETGAFAALAIDCFVCHGDVAPEHTNDPGRVHLSPGRDEEPLVVTSICGQCHLRGGRSRTTGRPWPRAFVAGDALLDDFEYDFSDGPLTTLSTADRHVAENVRDVVAGRTAVTCVSCHSIHGDTTRAHRALDETDLCFTCHVRGESRSRRHPFTRSNPVCASEGA